MLHLFLQQNFTWRKEKKKWKRKSYFVHKTPQLPDNSLKFATSRMRLISEFFFDQQFIKSLFARLTCSLFFCVGLGVIESDSMKRNKSFCSLQLSPLIIEKLVGNLELLGSFATFFSSAFTSFHLLKSKLAKKKVFLEQISTIITR